MATTMQQTAVLEQASAQGTWEIDPAHTEVGFEVKYLMISKVRGRFAGMTGALVLDESDPTRSSVKVEIDAASVDTRNEQRDQHLRSADFFDVERFPSLVFEARQVERVGADRYRVAGDLTIRDVTREVVLEVTDEGRETDPWGGERAAFSASTTVDRRDFGLTWNQALETGGVLVSNDIRIVLDVQLTKAG
jgi:polyisoprenoid-binding protein YceI